MNLRRSLVMFILAVAAGLPFACLAAIEILKEEPPQGTIPFGKVVYVDDGTCPGGEIKEITGGNMRRSIPRQVRCVKRPQ